MSPEPPPNSNSGRDIPTHMKRQRSRTVHAIRITIALAAVLFAPASVTAQPAAVPVTAAGQADTRQQTFTVGGFIPDGQRPTARPPTDVETARDTGNPWATGTLLDDRVWRSRARPGRGGGLAADAGAGRAGPRGTADATSPSAAADTTPPTVDRVYFFMGPKRGDTYAAGERIIVLVIFDEDISVTWSGSVFPPLTLAMQIGAATHHVPIFQCVNHRPGATHCEGPTSGFVFYYHVQEADYDPDGVSIPADALRLNGARIQDLAGNDAHLGLGPHAITNDPAHKVNGGLDHPPMITHLSIAGGPQQNDTYGHGERIWVRLSFDERIRLTGGATLALTIGSQTREATRPGVVFTVGNRLDFFYYVDATDKDTNGISIGADAFRLNGASLVDESGNPVPTSLAAVALTDDPDYRVDGTVEYRPKIDQVVLWSSPQQGDTYGRGETIEVRIGFDADVLFNWPTGAPPPLELTLQIGATERRVPVTFARRQLVFYYEVQASDYDLDGLSIAPNALRLVRGTIRDVLGRDITDLSLVLRHILTLGLSGNSSRTERVLMPQKRYIVRLTAEEREVCQQTVRKLKGSSEKVRRAQILLQADADGPGWTDQQIADALSCRTKTVENIRQRCVLAGFERALERKRRPSPPVPKLLDGEQEAQVIALRLGPPPKGYANWSLRLLARRVVELQIVESVSRETIRRTLKKTG